MITIRDGGLTSTDIATQNTPDGHIPWHNILGSVAVTGGTIQFIGPALVTPAQFGLSSVTPGVGNTVPVQIPAMATTPVTGAFYPAVQPSQFGLSSTVVGQQAMALSIPVAVASNQTPIPIYGNVTDSGSAKTLKTVVVGLQNSGTLITGIAGQRIKVYGVKIVASAAVSFKFTNNGSSDIEGGQNLAANGGFVETVNPPCFLFATALGSSLAASLTGSGVAGRISYWDSDTT